MDLIRGTGVLWRGTGGVDLWYGSFEFEYGTAKEYGEEPYLEAMIERELTVLGLKWA